MDDVSVLYSLTSVSLWGDCSMHENLFSFQNKNLFSSTAHVCPVNEAF